MLLLLYHYFSINLLQVLVAYFPLVSLRSGQNHLTKKL